jgi:hypothetical protein
LPGGVKTLVLSHLIPAFASISDDTWQLRCLLHAQDHLPLTTARYARQLYLGTPVEVVVLPLYSAWCQKAKWP